MRLITYQSCSGPMLGVLNGEWVRPVPGIDMLDLIRQGEPGSDQARASAEIELALSTLTLLAPIPNPPRNIMCLGMNYAAHAAESLRAKSLPIKMPVPGPFTLAGRLDGGEIYHDRQAITEALILIINAEIHALIAEGCRYIQLDEPSFACHPDNPEIFVDIINRTIAGAGSAYISMHMCFGNFRARAVGHRSYRLLFPGLLKANVNQLALEFASRELSEIELLKEIVDSGKSVAVGLVDVKNLWVEPVDLIVDRINTCLRYAPAELIHITPDCGFSQTARYAAVGKMCNLAQAAKKVRAALGLA